MAGITIFEVAPRDGLQNLPHFVSTEDKLHLITLIENMDIRNIEVASFSNPRIVPNMADAEEVVQKVLRRDNKVNYSVLVMGKRGLERAKAVNATNFNIVLSPDDEFNQSNFGKDLEAITAVYDEILTDIPKENVRVYISKAFDCPTENLSDCVLKGLEYGNKIVLCDTSGDANPFDIGTGLNITIQHTRNIAVHLHHGKMLMENVATAYNFGVREFDASIGGLGGCPFVPDSGANLATEDLVRWCDANGVMCLVKMTAIDEAVRFAKKLKHPTITALIKDKVQETKGRIKSAVWF